MKGIKIIKNIFSVICITIVMNNSIECYATNTKIITEQNSVREESNDLMYFSKDKMAEEEVEDIVTEIKKMKKNGNTDYALNLYVEKCFKEGRNKDKKVVEGLESYITNRLNSKEKALYKKNKAKALICMADGVMAIKYAEKYYNKSALYGGNGDAFRHTLWCYSMVIDVGESFAKKWSDAHENGDTEQPAIVKKMDLYNNKIDLKLGKDNPKTIKHSTFIKKTKQKVNAGKCRRIVNNKLVNTNKEGLK